MNTPLKLRWLTGEECVEIQKILRQRKVEASLRERALLIWRMAEGQVLKEVIKQVRFHYQNARKWVIRFNQIGLEGLKDKERSGRPPIYTKHEKEKILKIATSRPKDMGLNFTTWSLPKLQKYIRNKKIAPHIGIETIRRILSQAGFKYLASQTWCESNDPHFEVKKRNN